MNHNGTKLIFLIAVVAAVLFSRTAYPSATTADVSEMSQGGGDRIAQAVPLFVMPTVSAAAHTEEAPAGPPSASTDTSLPAGASSVFLRTGNTPPPRTGSVSSLVADLRSGTIFASTDPAKRWPTASITKLMTAAVAVDKLDPATKITITQEMFLADPTEATLAVGGDYSVADLLRAMLLPSSNVAAEALADFYGRQNFLSAMNASAAAWGMKDTYFGDPSGLSATNQSTADDLLLLAQNIFNRYPQIFQVTRTPQATITEQNSGNKLLIKSINNFAGAADFIGGKTGHTDEASGNLLSVFRYDGRPIAIVVLGTDNRFGDTQTLYTWFKANFK